MVLCVWFLLVVDTSASDCLERLVPEMTYYDMSRGTLNSTHSLQQPLLFRPYFLNLPAMPQPESAAKLRTQKANVMTVYTVQGADDAGAVY